MSQCCKTRKNNDTGRSDLWHRRAFKALVLQEWRRSEFKVSLKRCVIENHWACRKIKCCFVFGGQGGANRLGLMRFKDKSLISLHRL